MQSFRRAAVELGNRRGKKRSPGSDANVFESTVSSRAGASDVCYVASVLVTLAAESYRPREAFLGC